MTQKVIPYILNEPINEPKIFRSQKIVRDIDDSERDKSYAEYWIEEYGHEPDEIREKFIFPIIKKKFKNRLEGSKIYDFGSGAGNIIPFCQRFGVSFYAGFDVNSVFLDASRAEYESATVRFYRRDFEQKGWQRGIQDDFDLGFSIFVINELKNAENYLRGIKKLFRKGRLAENKKSKLLLVATHPATVLKDLSDFYLERKNSRKFFKIDSYRGERIGEYSFSRGDFSVPYKHIPLSDLFNLFVKCGFKIEYCEEIFFSGNSNTTSEIKRNILDSEHPKAIFFILG